MDAKIQKSVKVKERVIRKNLYVVCARKYMVCANLDMVCAVFMPGLLAGFASSTLAMLILSMPVQHGQGVVNLATPPALKLFPVWVVRAHLLMCHSVP